MEQLLWHWKIIRVRWAGPCACSIIGETIKSMMVTIQEKSLWLIFFVLTTTTWEFNCMNRSVCLRGITLLSVWIIKTGVDMLGMTIMTVQKKNWWIKRWMKQPDMPSCNKNFLAYWAWMPVSAMNTVALMEANGFRREELRYVRLKEIRSVHLSLKDFVVRISAKCICGELPMQIWNRRVW